MIKAELKFTDNEKNTIRVSLSFDDPQEFINSVRKYLKLNKSVLELEKIKNSLYHLKAHNEIFLQYSKKENQVSSYLLNNSLLNINLNNFKSTKKKFKNDQCDFNCPLTLLKSHLRYFENVLSFLERIKTKFLDKSESIFVFSIYLIYKILFSLSRISQLF